MTIQEFKDTFTQTLIGVYPPEEIHSFLYLTLEHFLGMSRLETALARTQTIKSEQRLSLEHTLERLLLNEPIQYILGKTEFKGLPFVVNEHTLIPRPETEELVDWCLAFAKANTKKKLRILDIGTGSGCIAICLAKELPEAEITAFDISEETLRMAQANAVLNKVTVAFECVDILNAEALKNSFDLIISNPPYVRNLEKKEIQANVLDNEPHQALFVTDENPLLFYKKITELAVDKLTPSGALFFEINQYLGEETVKLIRAEGFANVELRRDMFGNNRMIMAAR